MSAVYNRLNLEPGSALTNPIPNWLRLMRKDCGGSEVALWNKVRPHNGPLGAFVVRTLQICVLILAAIAMAAPLAAEDVNAPNPGAGRITGTVTDVDNDTVAGATVVLKGPVPGDPRTVVSDDDGFFFLKGLEPGTYSVGITANGFAAWTSPPIIVNPGQYVILTGSKLNIAEVMTTVSVDYSPEEVAIEQVRIEEEQRVLGIFPNFYVVYDHDAAPLTTKLKFQLAFKTSTDPVTVIGVGVLAGINQAGDTPNYPQGLKGYGERYGAVATDGLSDIMIGGAILPSLLHQDPRYFGHGHKQVSRFPRDLPPVHLQGRQWTYAAELLKHRRRPGLGRSLKPLLSAIQSRCWTGLPEFPYQHRRAHAQQPGTGVHLAQVVENQNRRIKATCER